MLLAQVEMSAFALDMCDKAISIYGDVLQVFMLFSYIWGQYESCFGEL